MIYGRRLGAHATGARHLVAAPRRRPERGEGGLAAPYSPKCLERLSGNSEGAPFRGPTSPRNGVKGLLFDALRYQETLDPIPPAIFQTVSRRGFLRSSHRASMDGIMLGWKRRTRFS